jgi:hypothetical protein
MSDQIVHIPIREVTRISDLTKNLITLVTEDILDWFDVIKTIDDIKDGDVHSDAVRTKLLEMRCRAVKSATNANVMGSSIQRTSDAVHVMIANSVIQDRLVHLSSIACASRHSHSS